MVVNPGNIYLAVVKEYHSSIVSKDTAVRASVNKCSSFLLLSGVLVHLKFVDKILGIGWITFIRRHIRFETGCGVIKCPDFFSNRLIVWRPWIETDV